MNYEKLKDLIKVKGLKVSKISIDIGRTEAWFHRAVKNDTMTISDLEKLLALCKTSLAEFFNGESSVYVTTTTVKEDAPAYGKQKDDYIIEVQKKLIDKLEVENEQLKKRLGEMKQNGVKNGV